MQQGATLKRPSKSVLMMQSFAARKLVRKGADSISIHEDHPKIQNLLAK